MADEDLNQQIGDYVLLEKIGCGGFGCVYKARHSRLPNRFVAVKMFLGDVDVKREREQFLREARLLDQLRHPAILSIIDVDVQENPLGRDIAYLVTELAPNGSLRDRLEGIGGPMPLDQSFKLLAQIGAGLSYAHERNVVHRDLKPENILFNDKGEALLADFGIATVLSSGSRTGDRFGTPAYMAPEQFEGILSKKIDQYALACIAYELLTGQHPFAHVEGAALLDQQKHTRPKRPRLINPSIPSTVENALLRALEKERADRYPDIATFLTALQSVPPPVSSVLLRASTSSYPDIAGRGRGTINHLGRGDQPRGSVVRWEYFDDAIYEYQRPGRSRRRDQLDNVLRDPPRVMRPRSFSRHRELFFVPPPADLSPRLQRLPPRLQRQQVGVGLSPSPVKRRDWSLISSGLLGFVFATTGIIMLNVFSKISVLLYFLCILLIVLGAGSLLLCFLQALVSSSRTKKWKWFAALLAGPLGFGLIGLLFFGFVLGLAGVVLGILLGIVISVVYGWCHPPEKGWSFFGWL